MAGVLSLKTPSTGLVTLTPTDTATDKTITLPATTGTVVIQDGTSTATVTNLAYTGTLTGGTGVVNLGSGQFYKDASGNVGIGTSSPASKLHVSGSFRQTGATVPFEWTVNSGAADFYKLNAVGFADNLIVANSSGNVGIGTNSPAQLIEVKKDQAASTYIKTTNKTAATAAVAGVLMENSTSSTASIELWDSGTVGAAAAYGLQLLNAGSGGVNILANNASGTIKFATGGTTERMRLDSSGNLLVGTTSNYTGKISANNASGFSVAAFRDTAGNGSQIRFQNSVGTQVGSVTNDSTTTTYNTSSDYRLKNITGAVTGEEAKEFIMALQPKKGTWKIDDSKFVGFLAHDFQKVSPKSVTGEKDAVDNEGNPIYQGMQAASSEVMANLIALVQEQQALIQDLTTRLNTLEGN